MPNDTPDPTDDWTPPDPLFAVSDACCDTCTGRRMATQRLLYDTVLSLSDEKRFNIRKLICSLASQRFVSLKPESAAEGSREQVRIAAERDEYASILEKYECEFA